MNNHTQPTILLASGNKGKLGELQQMIGDLAIVKSAFDLGVELPEETGETFAENAMLKTQAAFSQTGLISLADDSGLEVDALDGAPGVYSARYAGPAATDADNNAKLIAAMRDVQDELRSARFRSAIAITFSADHTMVFEGAVAGTIGHGERGSGGFGYDPLFVLPDGRTMAEYDADEKNEISHRGEAMRLAIPALIGHLQSLEEEP